jgi:hypothetical protein
MEKIWHKLPGDQIEQIKGLVGLVRLAVKGIEAEDIAPPQIEISGVLLTLDIINNRLDAFDTQIGNFRRHAE